MDRSAILRAEGTAEPGFLQRPIWAVPLFALLCIHGATTLTLFDASRQIRSLLDDRPILGGRHPLHLYHGRLGADAWRDCRFGSCYDPAFQAGYPKSPVFDSGSRPAELFLLIGGNRVCAYKIGLALCCLAVPLVFASSARLLGLDAAGAWVAAAVSVLLWWSGPVQRLVQNGDFDWLLAGQLGVLHAAALVRFHNEPGIRVWITLLVTSVLGWFAHPLVWLGLALLHTPYYVAVTMRHGLSWHLGVWLAWLGGIFANLGWLIDWVEFCWIQLPVTASPMEALTHTVLQWWQPDAFGDQADWWLGAVIFGIGSVGVITLLARGRTSAALTCGGSALLLPLLSFGSIHWQPLEFINAGKLLVLAIGFAVAPCAAAIIDLVRVPGLVLRQNFIGGLVGIALLATGAWFGRDVGKQWIRHVAYPSALPMGLSEDQHDLIRVLQTKTSPDARILWEDRPMGAAPSWTPLLPTLTDRAFLGGLDTDAQVEHMFARLTPTMLAGRPLSEWTDTQLEDFTRRYNIGYVACWSPEAVARFKAWPLTETIAPLNERGEGWLLAVRRVPQPHAWVLKGSARVTEWSARRIALADLVPEDGVVVLSLHYQEGFRVSPSDVKVERQPDVFDPIPLLRLRVPGPTLRVTLTWGD